MPNEKSAAKSIRPLKRFLPCAAGAVMLFLLWSLLPFFFGEGVVPFPDRVFARLAQLLSGLDWYAHLGLTLARTLAGSSLAFFLGTAAGMAAGRFEFLERSLFLPFSILQGAPPLFWIVPLVLLLGASGLAPVGVVFFVTLPFIYLSVKEGMKTLDPAALEMMRVYAPSRLSILRELYIPALAGQFRALLVAVILLGLKSAIIGEWFGAGRGIGRLINEYFYSYDMPSFYAAVVFYAAAAAFVAWGAGKIGARFFSRRPSRFQRPRRLAQGTLELVRRRARPARLRFTEVGFSFGEKTICDRLTFVLADGKPAVLSGESGAGKTTFARLAVGLLKPGKGLVAVPERACLIFQDDVFLTHRDCYGNVLLAAKKRAKTGAGERALAALRAAGLEHEAHRFPDELSGGMKKRLAFARALALDPDFLILDEPFNKLHKTARRELWRHFFSLFARKGIPVLIITHFPEELRRFRGLLHYRMKGGRLFNGLRSRA